MHVNTYSHIESIGHSTYMHQYHVHMYLCLCAQVKLKSQPTSDLTQAIAAMPTGKTGPSPVQFYSHREHTVGGSLSRLNRLASRTELSYLESFTESEEEGAEMGGEVTGEEFTKF